MNTIRIRLIYSRLIAQIFFILVFMLSVPVSLSSQGNTSGSNINAEKLSGKNVLILHSYHQGLEWTDFVTQGINSVFLNYPDINLFFEYMDAKRFQSNDYISEYYNYQKIKNRDVDIDIVITVDNAAYSFMIRHGKELYGDIPVIFCGVNNFSIYDLDDHENFLGIGERADHFGTIASVIKLFPERKNLLLINDTTITGKAINEELALVMPMFYDKLNFEQYSVFSTSELVSRVSNLDESWVIYILVVNRDKTGEFISYKKGIELINNNTDVPVFGSWDFYLGKGIVGGKITKGFDQGEYVAKTAVKILETGKINGQKRFKFLDSKYMFDYTEMEKFEIKRSDLPESSEIINDKIENRYLIKLLYVIGFLSILSIYFIASSYTKQRRARKLNRVVEEKTIELKTANARLSEVIVNKDKFLSQLAHDLRNPLGTAKSMLEYMYLHSSEMNNEKRDKLLKALTHQAAETYGLLEDLIHWGKLQFVSKVALNVKTIDVYAIVAELSELFHLNINHIKINNYVNKGIKVKADEFVARFIFRNIIQNAIKYSLRNGCVDISSRVTNNSVYINIKDYGIGMDQDIIKSIYNKKSIQMLGTNGQASTGLGLSAVIEYLENMNGELIIESEPEKGALVIVKLPTGNDE